MTDNRIRSRRALLFLVSIVILGASSIAAFMLSLSMESKYKQIPPGYVIGNPIDVGLINGMTAQFIQRQADKVSLRFTAQLSGDASKLAIYALATAGQPKVRIGLQEDSEGKPKGQWMSQNACGTVQVSSSSGFVAIKLQNTAYLAKGGVYHVVIEPAENPLNGTAAIATYMANSFVHPLNSEDPDINWNDTRINTLSNNGQGWSQEDKWPIFIVVYASGKSEGQPYSLVAPWVIWGATRVGQTIVPASNYAIGKMAFDISLKTDQPQDKLYYEIRDSSNNVLSKGVFAEPSQLTTRQMWIEVTLPSPVNFRADQLYRIDLFSPGTDLRNAYYLYGHEFSYDNTIGYGGLHHQLTSSLDSGANWEENPDADAIFKLTTGS